MSCIIALAEDHQSAGLQLVCELVQKANQGVAVRLPAAVIVMPVMSCIIASTQYHQSAGLQLECELVQKANQGVAVRLPAAVIVMPFMSCIIALAQYHQSAGLQFVRDAAGCGAEAWRSGTRQCCIAETTYKQQRASRMT
jgi:hypothetical protein